MERLIYLIAGEASGDRLGAGLMQALKQKAPELRFCGIGGPRMQAEGMDSLFPMEELAVMGLAEVLPRIPALRRRIHQTAADIAARKPDMLVTIDAPDFSFRVTRRVHEEMGMTRPECIHYVAPSVWAWRPGRAKKLAMLYDHLLCLLPFEPPYFEREGLHATFVGHPVTVQGWDTGDGAAFRARRKIGPDAPLLGMLPGSRQGELARLLPVYAETVRRLRREFPALELVVPALPQWRDYLMLATRSWRVPVHLVMEEEEKKDAYAALDAALVKSGTGALELAAAGVPHAVAYRTNPLTAALVRRLLKVDTVTLVNLVAGEKLVPEYLQQACEPEKLRAVAAELLHGGAAAQQQREGFERVLQKLKGSGIGDPSQQAAEVVLDALG